MRDPGPRGAATKDSKQKTLLAARAALEKKAGDLIIYDVSAITPMADYFIICSGDSHRQVRAIRDHIDEALAEKGSHPFSTEGENTCRWILMDYSDLIIHIFKEEVRRFYSLERLWGDAPQLDVNERHEPAGAARMKKAANDRPGRCGTGGIRAG